MENETAREYIAALLRGEGAPPEQQGGGDAVRQIIREMRERKVNHGKGSSPTLAAWADRLEAALAQDCAPQAATPIEPMAEGDKTAAQSRMIDELTAPVGDGPDWRYAAVSAIEYIDAGDHDEARDILRSALDLSDEASAPSAPVGVEGVIAEMRAWVRAAEVADAGPYPQAWRTVVVQEFIAKLEAALAQQPAAVDEVVCPSCERLTKIRHCQACGCDFIAGQQPAACDMGALCIGCEPRNADGSCPGQQPAAGDWIAAADVQRLVREIDVALNGDAGAAKQASLCDIAGQVTRHARLHGPVLKQPSAVDEAATVSAVAAIQFALSDSEGMTFLRLWNEGEFDTLRREWPDAPAEVYIDADPGQQPAADDRICSVCDGGPGNDGPCLCGERRWEQPAPSAPVGEARQAKEWLLELMGDHDFDMPTEAFDELVEALATQHQEPKS